MYVSRDTSFDCALLNASLCDTYVQRSAQDDDFCGGFRNRGGQICTGKPSK